MKRKSEFIEANSEYTNSIEDDISQGQDNTSNIIEQTHTMTATLTTRIKCPYLDTINRQILDFDSEKLCSVTLTNMNVYVCLVCGKYYQGRGKSTPLFTHSVQLGHFVSMNLHSGRTYCLPDNYEIIDSSLQDIQKCLSPSFQLQDINVLNSNISLARDIHGVSYLPGFVGLNNLNATDYISVLLHALAHVTPFRDFWLQNSNYELCKSNIVQQFGLTMRKMWSANNFKSTVSPQELMQEIIIESNKRFTIGQRTECIELLVWLLGALHKGLGKSATIQTTVDSSTINNSASGSNSSNNSTNKALPSSRTNSGKLNTASLDAVSVIYEPFQGIIEVTSLTKKLVDSYDHYIQSDRSAAAGNTSNDSSSEWVSSVQHITFNYLSVEIPPCPLFRDSEGGLIIPQIPLFEILKKFDGTTWTDQVNSEAHVRRKYRILQLPKYLILHLVRFTRNNFYLEKNPTIVTFPVKNLEMREYLFDETLLSSDITTTSVAAVTGSKSTKKQRADYHRMLGICPNLNELASMSCDSLVMLIQQIGSSLHKMQLQSIHHLIATSSTTTNSSSTKTEQLNEEQKFLLLLPIAESAVERVQMFRATKYDLLANICHDSTSSSKMVTVGDLNMLLGQSVTAAGKQQQSKSTVNTTVSATTVEGISTAAVSSNNRVLNDGMYKVHIQHKATGQWFEMQDLRVTEVTPQFIGVSESNILIYEKKSIVA